MGLDGMGWDGMGWDGMGCGGVGWDRVGQDGMGWGVPPADLVLDGGVLGVQLCGEVRVGDVGVVRGERVPRDAERAEPELRAVVRLAERVQHGAARLARHGLVCQHRQACAGKRGWGTLTA